MDKRDRRGAIDFNFPESKIVLDSEGIPVDIEPYERRIANRMIEEFMLVTNETVAEHFYWLTMPYVYRIHENPSDEKMATLGKFISSFGYKVNNGKDEEVHPKALQTVLKKIAGKPEESAISAIMLRSLRQARYSPNCEGHFGLAAKFYCHFTSPIRRYPDLQIHRAISAIMLRSLRQARYSPNCEGHFGLAAKFYCHFTSPIRRYPDLQIHRIIKEVINGRMEQARYSPNCEGHFGLAAKFYCHFTSPIRRYPDLQIHRIIKEVINGRMDKKAKAHFEAVVSYASDHSSEQERAADVAEREVDDYYKAVYMEKRIGQEYDGTVSGVTNFGIFVELPSSVEGLVRLADMGDDYYNYDEENFCVLGERTKKMYKIGDSVRIKVVNVDIDRKEIDFKILKKY